MTPEGPVAAAWTSDAHMMQPGRRSRNHTEGPLVDIKGAYAGTGSPAREILSRSRLGHVLMLGVRFYAYSVAEFPFWKTADSV